MTHWLNDVKWRALAQLKRKVRKDHRRFLFILLGPAGKVQSYHEVGRAMASSFADEVESPHFLSSHICDMNYSIAPIMCVIHHKTEIIQLKMYLFHSVRNLFKHRPENYFPFLCRWQTLTSTYHHVAVIFQDYAWPGHFRCFMRLPTRLTTEIIWLPDSMSSWTWWVQPMWLDASSHAFTFGETW